MGNQELTVRAVELTFFPILITEKCSIIGHAGQKEWIVKSPGQNRGRLLLGNPFCLDFSMV